MFSELEGWICDENGKMRKRVTSGNDVQIQKRIESLRGG
jgi:hypothetical protein